MKDARQVCWINCLIRNASLFVVMTEYNVFINWSLARESEEKQSATAVYVKQYSNLVVMY